jgi:hypothetical protein
MLNFFRKTLTYIVTGSCSIVFAACYGPPTRLENPRVLNLKDGDNNAIQGLKVSMFESNVVIGEEFTDKSGIAKFNFVQKNNTTYAATIEDIDGSLNGEFKTKTVDLTNEYFIEINMEKAK